MKKAIISLLFISIFTFNLFADDSRILNLELDLKLGLDFNPTLVSYVDNDIGGFAHEFNNSLLFGADFFILKFSNLYLGLGINHIFDTKIKTKGQNAEANITSYYMVGKYVMPIECKVFSRLYLIGNLGYTNTNIASTNLILSEAPEYTIFTEKFYNNNFSWEIGFGTEILDNFIAELTYSNIYGTGKSISEITDSMEQTVRENSLKTNYSLIMFKVGYKFKINTPQSNTKKEPSDLDKEIEKLKLQKEILELEIEKEKLKQ